MALKAVLAVSTCSVQLPERSYCKPRDRHCSGSIMLQHLVGSSECSATDNIRRIPSILVLNRERVFADGRPPHVGQGAGALAVYTFDLVGANDHVGDGGTGFELEDGVGVVSFSLAGTGDSSVKHHHAAVEGLAGCDRLRGGEDGCARGSWDVAA